MRLDQLSFAAEIQRLKLSEFENKSLSPNQLYCGRRQKDKETGGEIFFCVLGAWYSGGFNFEQEVVAANVTNHRYPGPVKVVFY